MGAIMGAFGGGEWGAGASVAVHAERNAALTTPGETP
jgi:hypothetical protein